MQQALQQQALQQQHHYIGNGGGLISDMFTGAAGDGSGGGGGGGGMPRSHKGSSSSSITAASGPSSVVGASSGGGGGGGDGGGAGGGSGGDDLLQAVKFLGGEDGSGETIDMLAALDALWAEETRTVRGIDSTYAIGAAGGEAGSGVGADIFKSHNDLPLARIKRIMKSDEDVRMISAEAPVLFAKACELFILDLTIRSFCHAKEERGKRRALTREDVCLAVQQTDVFDFLVGVLLPPGSRPQYIVDAENGVMHPMYDTLAEHALLGGGGGGGGGGELGGGMSNSGGGGDISALLEVSASAGNIGLLPSREDPTPTPVPEVSISQSSNAKKGGGGGGGEGGSKAKKGKKGS